MVLEEKVYVDMLVKSNIDKDVAKAKVKEVISVVKEALPNESEDYWATVVGLKLRDMVKASQAEKYRALCVAIDEMKDSLGYQKYKALEAYKENAAVAIQDGLVKLDGEKVIPLDTREYYDEEKTKQNKNFGKPLPTVMRREGYFVIEGKLVRGFGEFEAEPGAVYEIFGNINDKGFLNINKSPEMRLVEKLKESDFWEAVYNAAGESELRVDLNDIREQKKGTTVLTKGFLGHSQRTSNGGTMVVLNDDEVVDGVVGFGSYDKVSDGLETIPMGTEVIVVGRIMVSKDRAPGIVIVGAVKNPASTKVADVLKSDKLSKITF